MRSEAFRSNDLRLVGLEATEMLNIVRVQGNEWLLFGGRHVKRINDESIGCVKRLWEEAVHIQSNTRVLSKSQQQVGRTKKTACLLAGCTN